MEGKKEYIKGKLGFVDVLETKYIVKGEELYLISCFWNGDKHAEGIK
jgi:hypothetical protein